MSFLPSESEDIFPDYPLPPLVIWSFAQSNRVNQHSERRVINKIIISLASCCHQIKKTIQKTRRILHIFRRYLLNTIHLDNAGVIINPKGEMKGSAITGPVGKEAADLWPKIASAAGSVL